MTALKIWTKLIFNDDYQTISQRSTEGVSYKTWEPTSFLAQWPFLEDNCRNIIIAAESFMEFNVEVFEIPLSEVWQSWPFNSSLAFFFYSQVEHLIKPQLKLNSKALDLVDEVDNLVYRWRNDCPRIQIILFTGVFGFKSLNYGMERSEGSP